MPIKKGEIVVTLKQFRERGANTCRWICQYVCPAVAHTALSHDFPATHTWESLPRASTPPSRSWSFPTTEGNTWSSFSTSCTSPLSAPRRLCLPVSMPRTLASRAVRCWGSLLTPRSPTWFGSILQGRKEVWALWTSPCWLMQPEACPEIMAR